MKRKLWDLPHSCTSKRHFAFWAAGGGHLKSSKILHPVMSSTKHGDFNEENESRAEAWEFYLMESIRHTEEQERCVV